MLLLSVFFLTVKSTKRLSNKLFALFLLITAFDLTGFFLAEWIAEYLNLQILKTASSLLQMPLFFLYVLSVCYSDFSIKFKHITHSFLFFAFLILFKATSLSTLSLNLFEIIGELQWFTYIILIFITLKNYKVIYQENYSSYKYLLYKWLFQIALLFCVSHFFVFIRWCLSYNEKYTSYILYLNIIISILAVFVITFLVLKALYQPQLFTGVKSTIKPIKRTKNLDNSNLPNDETKRLISFMKKEKPFLDFELTLQKLASQINIPEKELSILINHYLGKHFFDFINEYRINEAKNILENPYKNETTTLEILYQVGFSSKSSFYTAFKKNTNQTPTQYRKQSLSK